jgi:hypothetical protein
MASATSTMIEIKLIDGWYMVTTSRCTMVLSRSDFIMALKRGRWWKRRQAFQARLAAVTDRTKEEESSGQQCESR